MILPIRLRIPALGGIELVGEIELPDSLASRPEAPADLTDSDLRARWRCSARTVKRLRDAKRLPYYELRPRLFRYRLADVEAFECAARTGPGAVAVRRRA
jgi:hypothetical protein